MFSANRTRHSNSDSDHHSHGNAPEAAGGLGPEEEEVADARQYAADGVLAGLEPSGGSGRYDDDLSESDYEEEDAAEEDAAEGESPEKEVLEDTEPDKAEAEAQKAPG